MKPQTSIAMEDLIAQIRAVMPVDLPEDALCCSKSCDGCSQKLLEFLDTTLEDWELRLLQGEQPSFGDINQLVKTSIKIYTVLEKNGLVAAESTTDR